MVISWNIILTRLIYKNSLNLDVSNLALDKTLDRLLGKGRKTNIIHQTHNQRSKIKSVVINI